MQNLLKPLKALMRLKKTIVKNDNLAHDHYNYFNDYKIKISKCTSFSFKEYFNNFCEENNFFKTFNQIEEEAIGAKDLIKTCGSFTLKKEDNACIFDSFIEKIISDETELFKCFDVNVKILYFFDKFYFLSHNKLLIEHEYIFVNFKLWISKGPT